MTVLHVAVSWRRASRAGGQLLFWGEADEPPPEAGGRVAIGLRRYPAAMDPEALDAATEAYARAIGVPFPRGSFEVTRFYLPTRKGRPLGSGPSAGSSKGPERGVDRLSPWAVPARRVSYVEALPWLAALPIGAEAEDLPRMGGDLRYLSRVAKFVLGLLVRRRIVPVLAEGSTGAAEGRWRASLATDEELAEGERLKRLTPASLTAVRGEAKPPGPGSLIRALLDEGVDGLARSWLAEGPPAPRHDLPEGRWAAALTSPRPLLELPRAQRGELREGVEAWTGQPVDEPARYRTCFRLDAPRPDGEDGDEAVDPLDTSEGAWRLEALLQARDDPSELILAVDAVADPRSLPRRAGQDSRTVVDGLLGDLHRAGRIHPPIAGLLAHRLPSALSISTAEAYDFLRTAGPLLAECGFGLLVPPWWSTRRPPLGAKLKIRPTAAEGQFGLDALLQYDLVVALGDRLLSREELDRLARLKVPLVRYRGRWVEIRPEDVAGAVRAFEQRTRGTLTLREVLSADVEGRLGGLPILGVIPSEGLRELWTALRGDVRFEEIVPPAELRATLRPYQLRGYSWLTFWHRLGLGACLADDMGLGKTVQCLAALLGSRPSGAKGAPALLVCPTSVIENWRRETEQFAPSLAVRVHHGEDRPRRPSAFAARYRSVDVVVTSYALLWRDAELLRSRAWDTVVLDEAQNIKNPLAKASQSAFALRARHRVALTGTPVENRLSELWSIMQFLNPGLLGPLATFEARFATPIERFSDGEAARTLQRLIRPLVLRRLKSDPEIVPDLPEKIEIRTDCSLTPEQASLYEATVREMLERIEGSEGIDRRARILTALTKLKQVCDHPALLLKDRSAIPGRSGKLERLEELLEEALAEGDSALVFTQWREMGEMLRRRLGQRFGCPVGFFHGGLSIPEREQLLEEFRAGGGPRILVLTLKAGGFGLNLTQATRVFHYDRWWNPAVENQATDRAHRIGQRRRVMVHKLVVAGTVEDRIDALLKQKSGLAEAVLAKGEGALTELSTGQLRELFALRSPEGRAAGAAGAPEAAGPIPQEEI